MGSHTEKARADADAIVDELMSRKRAGQQKRSLSPQPTTPTDAEREAAREVLSSLSCYTAADPCPGGDSEDIDLIAQAIADGGTS